MFGGMPSPFEPRPMRNPFTGDRESLREAVVAAAERLQAVCDHPATEARMEHIIHAGAPECLALEHRELLHTLSTQGVTAQTLKEACNVS